MKLGILAAVTALAVASPVMAGDWRLAASNDVTIKGYDLESVVINGSKRMVWEVMVFRNTEQGDVDYIVSRTEYDCANGRYRDHAMQGYLMGGRSTTRGDAGEWMENFPDSLSSGSNDAVCGRRETTPLDVDSPHDFAAYARAVLEAD